MPPGDQIAAEDVQRALNISAHVVYEQLAQDYDRHLLEDCSYRAHEKVASLVLEHTGSDARILDLGAGTGLIGKAFLDAGSSSRLVGVDLVRAMLARNQCAAYSQLVVADATRHMPFRPESFDAAVAAGLVEHVVDPGLFLERFLRAVKPGGVAVFTYVPNHRGQTEVFDQNAGLLSHDRGRIASAIRRLPGEVVAQSKFDAYQNGEEVVQHEVVAVVCTQHDSNAG